MANPVDARLDGQALMSFGFVGGPDAISGVGLNTFGFLWPCADIWTPISEASSTTWTDCSQVNPSDGCNE